MEQHPFNILLVDDEPVIRRLIKAELLSHTGDLFEIFEAQDGEEALSSFTPDIHVVVTDIKMPRLGGLDLLHAIRNASSLTEIIVVTGYATVDNAMEALRNGAFDYLLKPFDDLESVYTVIKNAAQKSRLARENLRLLLELQAANRDLELRVAERSAIALRDNEKMRSLIEHSDSYLTGLAHSLKATTGSLTGLLDIVADPSSDAPQRLECCDLMRDHLVKHDALVASALLFSRFSSGELPRAAFGLEPFFKAIVAHLRSDMERQGVTLAYAFDILDMSAHRDAMYQVVVKLLSFALSTAPVSPQTWNISSTRNGNSLVLRIHFGNLQLSSCFPDREVGQNLLTHRRHALRPEQAADFSFINRILMTLDASAAMTWDGTGYTAELTTPLKPTP